MVCVRCESPVTTEAGLGRCVPVSPSQSQSVPGNVCSVSRLAVRCPGSKNGSVNLPVQALVCRAGGLPPPTLNILQT